MIVGLASLYEPLEFLENRIRNLNQCDLNNTIIYWCDVSSESTWLQVQDIISSQCNFEYRLKHFGHRHTLYWVWNWIIRESFDKLSPQYFCNVNVDDINHPAYFTEMCGYLKSNVSKVLVASPWGVVVKKNQIWLPEIIEMICPDPTVTCGHFTMWRACVHNSIGLFDERMVCIGDAAFWGKIGLNYGYDSIGVIQACLACYLSHDNNLYDVAKGPNGEHGETYDMSLMKYG